MFIDHFSNGFYIPQYIKDTSKKVHFLPINFVYTPSFKNLNDTFLVNGPQYLSIAIIPSFTNIFTE